MNAPEWVVAQAGRLEGEGVTRADTDRLAAAGWYGLTGPPELGGCTPAEFRCLAEQLAGASPDLWFVWFQHGPVVRTAGAADRADLLPGLCSGDLQAGVAFSHLRSGRPTVEADRVAGGWRLTGAQPWCTGWGIVDVLLAGAVDRSSGEVLLGLLPVDRPGLSSTGPLGLAAMAGTATHGLRLEGVVLRDADVLVRRPYAEWLAADRVANSNAQPSTFGVAACALDLLEGVAAETAEVLRERLDALRGEAYRLIDDVPPDDELDRRLAVRAAALLMGVECATALIAARGGAAMSLEDPAQRLLRAAAFQVVHAQAPHVRAATLTALRCGSLTL